MKLLGNADKMRLKTFVTMAIVTLGLGIFFGTTTAFALALMYFTVPMVYMPTNARVWGLGALLFFILAILIWYADRAAPKD